MVPNSSAAPASYLLWKTLSISTTESGLKPYLKSGQLVGKEALAPLGRVNPISSQQIWLLTARCMIIEAKTWVWHQLRSQVFACSILMPVTFVTCKDDFFLLLELATYLKEFLNGISVFPEKKILSQSRNCNTIYYTGLFSIKRPVHLRTVSVVLGKSGRVCAWVTT